LLKTVAIAESGPILRQMKRGVTVAMATVTMSVMAATGIAGADPGAPQAGAPMLGR
jgi:hypothetical protein